MEFPETILIIRDTGIPLLIGGQDEASFCIPHVKPCALCAWGSGAHSIPRDLRSPRARRPEDWFAIPQITARAAGVNEDAVKSKAALAVQSIPAYVEAPGLISVSGWFCRGLGRFCGNPWRSNGWFQNISWKGFVFRPCSFADSTWG